MCGLPHDVERVGFAEYRSLGTGGGPCRVETECREAGEQLRHRRPRLEPGEIHSDAHVRPLGEGKVPPHVRPPEVESIGVDEDRWIPVCVTERHDNHVTGRDLGAGHDHVGGGVPVDHRCRRFESQRLLDGRRNQRRVGSNGGELHRRW